MGVSKLTKRNTLLSALVTVLCILCFPANPLVLTGVIEAKSYLPLFIIGCLVRGVRYGTGYGTNSDVPTPRWCFQGQIVCEYHSPSGYWNLCRGQTPAVYGGSFLNIYHHIIVVPALAIRLAGCDRHRCYIPEL